MPTTPITDPASGESLVGTEPQLEQQIAPGYWRQRLNLFTGRALTVSALDSEQTYRGGLLATLGQSVTAGTVTGLALTLNTNSADPVITVAPGYGITADGQDVVLNTTLKTNLSAITVIDPVTGEDLYTFHQSVGDPAPTLCVCRDSFCYSRWWRRSAGSCSTAAIFPPLSAAISAHPAGRTLRSTRSRTGRSPTLCGWSMCHGPAAFPRYPCLRPRRRPHGETAWPTPSSRLKRCWAPTTSCRGLWLGCRLPSSLSIRAWRGSASTAYTASQFITDSNSNIQVVKTGGTTSAGPAQPVWNIAWGGLTTDGGVTWTNSGLGWRPLFVDCSAVVRAGGLPRNRYVLPIAAFAAVRVAIRRSLRAGRFHHRPQQFHSGRAVR